ncbi:conserved hypothetical protein [Tenacibaculum litopenaei]
MIPFDKALLKIVCGTIIALLFLIYYRQNKNQSAITSTSEKMKPNFYSLNDGNQNDRIISIQISQKWLDSIKSNFDWNEFDEYDNRLWEYMYKLFDESIEKSGIADEKELWNTLNREQKIFWAFLAFNGDTDNGGVFQFIFNRPEFIISVAETFEELGMTTLTKDYHNVLDELSGKSSKIGDLKTVFNDDSKNWSKRWKAFSEGYKELISAQKIELYYYEKAFKKKLYQKITERIERNMDKFATIVE